MTMMSGAQMVVRTLEDLGVDRLFGYPGGAVLNMYDALYKHKNEIKHVYTDEEIIKINTKVKNEMKMDNLAIKTNYFAYLENVLKTNNNNSNNNESNE